MRFRSAQAIALPLGILMLTLRLPAQGGELRQFGPLCAKLDLEAIAVIERRGDEESLQASNAAAGLQLLAARAACLEGRVEAGADLYGGILRREPASASVVNRAARAAVSQAPTTEASRLSPAAAPIATDITRPVGHTVTSEAPARASEPAPVSRGDISGGEHGWGPLRLTDW